MIAVYLRISSWNAKSSNHELIHNIWLSIRLNNLIARRKANWAKKSWLTTAQAVVHFPPIFPWVLYISTNIWVMGTPNSGWNMLFQRFSCKKAGKKEENARKLRQNFAVLFFSLHPIPRRGLYSQIETCLLPYCHTARHARPSLPVTPLPNPALPKPPKWRKGILAAVWSVQLPNPGRNIQHLG